MVIRKNVSCRQDLTPPREGSKGKALKISGGPLYKKTDVCELLSKGAAAINLWTEDCNYDVVIKLEWDMQDVLCLIDLAMQKGIFKGSEWCHQSGEGPIAACDAYCVSRNEWVKTSNKEMNMTYFVKFSVSKTGMLMLVASCHLSN